MNEMSDLFHAVPEQDCSTFYELTKCDEQLLVRESHPTEFVCKFLNVRLPRALKSGEIIAWVPFPTATDVCEKREESWRY
jgi:hypothetical protein